MYDGPPGCSSSHEARDLYVSRYGGMTALDLIQMNSQLYNYSMRVGVQQSALAAWQSSPRDDATATASIAALRSWADLGCDLERVEQTPLYALLFEALRAASAAAFPGRALRPTPL